MHWHICCPESIEDGSSCLGDVSILMTGGSSASSPSGKAGAARAIEDLTTSSVDSETRAALAAPEAKPLWLSEPMWAPIRRRFEPLLLAARLLCRGS